MRAFPVVPLAFLASGLAAPTALYSCSFDGFVLTVFNDSAFSYSVVSALTGSPWLENGTLAIQSAGRLLSAGAGLQLRGEPELGTGVDGVLGAFTFLSLSWEGGGGESLSTNFSCYTDFGLAAFSALFPEGLSPLAPGMPGTPDTPSTRFPCFSADPGSALLSDAMGFVEWAGEMDTYKNAHGTGLKGYSGG
jgi:hypothetical protein